ncbi:hypothetical protein Tco_1355454 [Tanacetum coccineum]
MARQCTQPKRPRNAAWYKEKAMLVEAQKAGQILYEEQLAFLADPRVLDRQAVQTIIPNNAAFQTKDLDTYDSDCDDISNAQAVLMANISNYGSDVISKDFEQPPGVDFIDNEIHSDSNIIPYSQYLQETQQEKVQDTHLHAQQDSMILSVIEQIRDQAHPYNSPSKTKPYLKVLDLAKPRKEKKGLQAVLKPRFKKNKGS